jgi:hypothetical protein
MEAMTEPVEELTPDQAEQRRDCYSYQRGFECRLCEHRHCGWCPECAPEVPD